MQPTPPTTNVLLQSKRMLLSRNLPFSRQAAELEEFSRWLLCVPQLFLQRLLLRQLAQYWQPSSRWPLGHSRPKIPNLGVPFLANFFLQNIGMWGVQSDAMCCLVFLHSFQMQGTHSEAQNGQKVNFTAIMDPISQFLVPHIRPICDQYRIQNDGQNTQRKREREIFTYYIIYYIYYMPVIFHHNIIAC